jgi:ABC-2 type transport system ATP-binding protein
MNDVVIALEDLRVVYRVGFTLRPKVAVAGASFQVRANEIIGYIGANGAGKTTTIKVMVGLQRPTAGSAEVFGIDVRDAACRKRIGFLPENPYFYEYLKAREALRFYGALSDVPGAELEARIDKLLAQVKLENAADQHIRGFSKGMRQRLGLAQALINDPDLVILDEPMSGLDPLGRAEVRKIIVDLGQQGKTVFFSSHILSDAEALCDRVGLLVGGRVVRESSMAGLLEEQVQYWDAASEGVAPDAVPGFDPHSSQGDHHYYRLADEEEVTRWVDAVRSGGGNVYRIAPQRTTLEDYFVAAVKEDEDR